MSISDQQRCFKLKELIVDEVAKVLRAKWKKEWKLRTGFDWSDSSVDKRKCYGGKTCRNYFLDVEIAEKRLILSPSLMKRLRDNESDEWDVSLLCSLLKFSSIFKTPLSRNDLKAIEVVKAKRNELVGHLPRAEVNATDFERHSSAILKALVQLGADIVHLKEFMIISTPASIAEESLDPRDRLHRWLDTHFIGSDRVVASNAAELTSTDEPSHCLTAIDEDTPRLVFQVKPEDITLPALNTPSLTLIVGSRGLIEQGLAEGSVQPEIRGERWLLALDDNELASTQCVVYFDPSATRWMVEAPTIETLSTRTAAVHVTSPASPETTEILSPGASHILWVGCNILFGKHRLKVIELSNGATVAKERIRNLIMPTVAHAPLTSTTLTPYIPYGRVACDAGQFDVVLDSNEGGTFGSIYKVRNVSTGKFYAMKCPKFLDQRRVAALRNELEAYLELDGHPGIVEVTSFFMHENIPHIIMSYAAEGSLESWLSLRLGSGKKAPRLAPRITTVDDNASNELLSPRQAICRMVDILVQLADALSFAHKRGFIHADVKPGNVLVASTYSAEGLLFLDVKLCDFGICGHESQDRAFGPAAGKGSEQYQSPEQLANNTVTDKSDVWSLTALATVLFGKCMAPYSQRIADLREEQFNTELLQFMVTTSTCQCIPVLFRVLHAGMETALHRRLSMNSFLNGLLHFADSNSLYSIDTLELFDYVIVRHSTRAEVLERTENDRKYQLHKLTWSAEWSSELCGDTDAADRIYQRLIAEFSDYPYVFSNYALFLEKKMGNYESAERYYRKAVELSPDNATVLYNMAEFLFSSKRDVTKSISLLKKCVALDRTNAVAFGLLAVVYEQTRDFSSAERCYLQAMDLDPNSPVRLVNYALFLEQHKGDYDKAEEYYRKAIRIKPDFTSALFNLGDLLETKDDPAGAEKIYQRLLEVDPNNVLGLNNYGQLMSNRQNYIKAETLLTRLLRIDPTNIIALCNQGMIFYKKQDAATALSYFNRVIAIDAEHSHALCCIGQCYLYIYHDKVTATSFFEKSIASDPENHIALFHYGVMLSEDPHNAHRALAMLERADVACGHQSEEIKAAIRRLRTVGLFTRHFTPPAPPQPMDESYETSVQLKEEGNRAFKDKDYEAAIAKYVRACVLLAQGKAQSTRVNELKVSLNLNLAACHVARKAWDKVVIYCGKALELDPNNSKAYYRRAIANEAAGNVLLAWDDIQTCRRNTKTADSAVTEALHRIETTAAALRPQSAPEDSRIPRTHTIIYGHELVVGRVHTARYIVGVITNSAFKMTGIHFNIEDARGNTVAISLYNFDGPSGPTISFTPLGSSAANLFDTDSCESLGLKSGRRICIVDPLYKQRMDGSLGIRVEKRENVILM